MQSVPAEAGTSADLPDARESARAATPAEHHDAPGVDLPSYAY